MVGRFPKCAIDYGERRISAEYDSREDGYDVSISGRNGGIWR